MDERTMFELLEAHDAMEELGEVLEALVGVDPAVGYGEGILGKLSYIGDIIMRHSPLHEPGVDYQDTAFGKIMDDREMDNHKKARLLLGMTE